jgi:ADP-ribosylglycohydrolase
MKLKDSRPDRDRRLGVMFGLAYGDALGRPTEFARAADLNKLGTPFQHRVGINSPKRGIVTDDTQMSIAVARAALNVTREGAADPQAMTSAFIQAFIGWYKDPASRDGRRAPGGTCLGAVSALIPNPRQWLLATRPESKGNGANMRVCPLALCTDWTWDQLGAAAQLQAAITHGHPTALAAAELTAVAVRLLLTGYAKPTDTLIDHLLVYAYDRRDIYHGKWLGTLWESWLPKGPTTPQEYIQHGWDEVISSLMTVYRISRNPRQDPCEVAGGGWVAEEALSAAVHTLLCFPGDPTNALRRAAFTDGDSDSIASITGALAGAAYGRSAFPSHWIGNLEYRHELASLAAKLPG